MQWRSGCGVELVADRLARHIPSGTKPREQPLTGQLERRRLHLQHNASQPLRDAREVDAFNADALHQFERQIGLRHHCD